MTDEHQCMVKVAEFANHIGMRAQSSRSKKLHDV
jgi:hypothetical protein